MIRPVGLTAKRARRRPVQAVGAREHDGPAVTPRARAPAPPPTFLKAVAARALPVELIAVAAAMERSPRSGAGPANAFKALLSVVVGVPIEVDVPRVADVDASGLDAAVPVARDGRAIRAPPLTAAFTSSTKAAKMAKRPTPVAWLACRRSLLPQKPISSPAAIALIAAVASKAL